MDVWNDLTSFETGFFKFSCEKGTRLQFIVLNSKSDDTVLDLSFFLFFEF